MVRHWQQPNAFRVAGQRCKLIFLGTARRMARRARNPNASKVSRPTNTFFCNTALAKEAANLIAKLIVLSQACLLFSSILLALTLICLALCVMDVDMRSIPIATIETTLALFPGDGVEGPHRPSVQELESKGGVSQVFSQIWIKLKQNVAPRSCSKDLQHFHEKSEQYHPQDFYPDAGLFRLAFGLLCGCLLIFLAYYMFFKEHTTVIMAFNGRLFTYQLSKNEVCGTCQSDPCKCVKKQTVPQVSARQKIQAIKKKIENAFGFRLMKPTILGEKEEND